MKQYTVFSLITMFILTIYSVSQAETISVNYYSGSTTISLNGSSTVIGFSVYADHCDVLRSYGWAWSIEGPNPQQSQDIESLETGWSSYNAYFTATLGPGTHTAHVSLYRWVAGYGWSELAATGSTNLVVNKEYQITIQNSFYAGEVSVDGGTYNSGASFVWISGQTHTLGETDGQTSGGYVQRFQIWSGQNISNPTSLSTSITVPFTNATYTANFKKEYNITFQNNYPGYGNGGVINVNGMRYNSPTSTFAVHEDNTITGGVVNTYQVIDGIEYTFSSWSPGGSTSSSTQFTPTDHTTYTANFNAKPLPPPNVSAGGAVDDPVQVTWSEHPHTSVTQYQIWRIIKPMGQSQGSPELIETVSRGTTSFIDYGCIVTSGYTHDLVSYDVRAYFDVTSSYSDPSYVAVFADSNPPRRAEDQTMRKTALPNEFSVSNYPNPFNPSTTFSYQLTEDAVVELKVFDLMGREIASLVNGTKSAGYHSVVWDSKNKSGAAVSSGLYLYRFTAVSSGQRELFRKSGKLILMK